MSAVFQSHGSNSESLSYSDTSKAANNAAELVSIACEPTQKTGSEQRDQWTCVIECWCVHSTQYANRPAVVAKDK